MYKIIFSILSVIVFSFTNNNNIYGQQIIITYSKSFEKTIDTIESIAYTDRIRKLNSLLDYHSNDLSYDLVISDLHSKFEETKALLSDSDENDIIKKLAGSIGGTKGIFYINKRDSIFINKIKFADQEYRIKMEAGNWSISKETKMINNYTCFKATRTEAIDNSVVGFKNTVTAWFCPTLPSFYGPACYFGLPGMILEVTNGRTILQATKINFDKGNKEEIKMLDGGKLLTKKEYEELIRKIAEEKFQFNLKN